jgi:uncharacterized membrane protein YdcZ (DUF606 family)
MKSLFWMLPVLVGISTVIQGGINRRLSDTWGLGWALFFNCAIVMLLSMLLVMINVYPGKMSLMAMASSIRWWHFVPGFAGMIVVLCIPLSIAQLGALNSFLILVSSQILVSGLWDRLVDGIGISWTRALGAFLALFGAWLATR